MNIKHLCKLTKTMTKRILEIQMSVLGWKALKEESRGRTPVIDGIIESLMSERVSEMDMRRTVSRMIRERTNRPCSSRKIRSRRNITR